MAKKKQPPAGVVMPAPEPVAYSALHLAGYNPRRMPRSQMDRLKASIRAYGFVQPVVARTEDGLVMGGHQRLAALAEIAAEDGLDLPTLPVPTVRLPGITDARAKALNLALNKVEGEWDYEKLADVLAGIVADTTTLALSGFDRGEVDDILATTAQAPPVQPGTADPDALLAAKGRRLVFLMESDTDADVVRSALRAHGMTGPGNAPAALVALARTVGEE